MFYSEFVSKRIWVKKWERKVQEAYFFKVEFLDIQKREVWEGIILKFDFLNPEAGKRSVGKHNSKI